MKIVHCSLHRLWNRDSSPAASSAKADISKFLLLPSFDINLHFLFNNESSTDKQLNIVQDEVNQEESE